MAHLKALDDALPGTLELWDADLLQEGSFDAAIQCVSPVLNTVPACPYF